MLSGNDVEVDDGDYHQRTALHLAASSGHIAMGRHLVLIHGANMNVLDRSAPASCQCSGGNLSINGNLLGGGMLLIGGNLSIDDNLPSGGNLRMRYDGQECLRLYVVTPPSG